MAFVHGKNAVFSVDDSGGTLRNISSQVNNVSGLPGARALSEVTAFGDGGTKSIPGLQDVSFTVAGMYDSTALTGTYTVLNGLRTAAATSTFEYGPEGSTTGKPKMTGECWLSELNFDASVGDMVPFSATFKVDGLVTTTVY